MGYHTVGNSIHGPSAHSDDLCSSSLSVSGDTALDLANRNAIFHAPLFTACLCSPSPTVGISFVFPMQVLLPCNLTLYTSLFVTDKDPQGQNIPLKCLPATYMLKMYLFSSIG